MRFVNKKDEDKTERLSSDETYQALLEIVNTKNKSLITDTIYRESYSTPDGKRSRVEDKLAISYKYKCAYCERICKADIEHYRPKKKVDDVLDHPGYYWLCYEWTNLIPSCITCNREGAKHNKFPIIGNRINTPSMLPDGNLNLPLFKAGSEPLIGEKPYLLHPEVDKPELYFEFELDKNGEGIRIVGIDEEGRGEKTIDICLLNRKELKLDRVERVIDDFKDSVHCLVAKLDKGIISVDQFRENMVEHIELLQNHSLKESKTHTLLRKFIMLSVPNFEKIVIPYLHEGIRKIVLEAFISFKE